MKNLALSLAAVAMIAATAGCDEEPGAAGSEECDVIGGCEQAVSLYPVDELDDGADADQVAVIYPGIEIRACSDEWDAPHAVVTEATLELGGLVQVLDVLDIERPPEELERLEADRPYLVDSMKLGTIRYIGALDQELAPAREQSVTLSQQSMDLELKVLNTGSLYLAGEVEDGACVSLFGTILDRL